MLPVESEFSCEQVIQSLTEIAREIERIEHAREVFLKATHGRFNLFTTLLDAHDEVRLHTRFLVHLLNPQGEHDCGGLFLDLFLGVVGLSKDLKAAQCRKVLAEYYTGGLGNIDILMEFETATVIIENKIFAADQDRQLARYAEYADKRGVPRHILYLTLDGHNSSHQSRSGLSEEDVKCISYRDDILLWLDRCLQNTYEFVNINQALMQYRQTVCQLLGITLEAKDMNKIKEMLKNRPEIMTHAKAITEALQSIQDEEQKKIKTACLEALLGQAKGKDHAVWPKPNNECAHKFFSESWGSNKTTDITVYCHNNGLFSLLVYDCENGKLRKNIDEMFGARGWMPESNYFWREILGPNTLDMVLAELRKIADKLQHL